MQLGLTVLPGLLGLLDLPVQLGLAVLPGLLGRLDPPALPAHRRYWTYWSYWTYRCNWA